MKSVKKICLALGVGLISAGYLEWVAILGESPSCPVFGGGCQAVLSSDIAKILPFRLSTLGCAYFLFMLLSSTMVGDQRVAKVWKGLLHAGLIVSILLTAWVTVTLKVECSWCLAVLASLLVANIFNALTREQLHPVRANYTIAAVILALAAPAAVVASSRDTGVRMIAQRRFESAFDGFPVVGVGRPKRAVIVDYACPHSRSALRQLETNGVPVYVVAIRTGKVSAQYQDLGASAMRQGLLQRFFERLPDTTADSTWLRSIQKDIGCVAADQATAIRLSHRAKQLLEEMSVRRVPTWITSSPSQP